MRFLVHPAPPVLAEHVQELWLLDDDGSFHAGLPKPYVELVVSLSGIHWWRASRAGREHRYEDAWVTPLQDGPRYARSVGRRRLIGARLQPWSAAALFGPLPPGRGQPPPRLATLIGAEASRLRRSLIRAPDDQTRFSLFAHWLSAAFAACPARAPGMPGAVAVAPGSASHLARALRTSPRALRRQFARHIGLSPKQWLKLHRLDAVLRDAALRDRTRSLAAIALDHGYADQSHLSREVADMTGSTPGALRRRPEGVPPHLLPRG